VLSFRGVSGSTVKREAPAAGLRLVGWIWIFTGVVTALLVLAGLLCAARIEQAAGTLDGFLGGSAAMDLGAWLMRHVVAVSLAHLALAALSVVGGVGLIRCWPWARATVAGLCWLSTAYALLFGVYLVMMWWAVVGELFRGEGRLVLFQLGGTLLCVIVTVALAVPLVIMVRYLNRAS
jgi:hypothetical protein